MESVSRTEHQLGITAYQPQGENLEVNDATLLSRYTPESVQSQTKAGLPVVEVSKSR